MLESVLHLTIQSHLINQLNSDVLLFRSEIKFVKTQNQIGYPIQNLRFGSCIIKLFKLAVSELKNK